MLKPKLLLSNLVTPFRKTEYGKVWQSVTPDWYKALGQNNSAVQICKNYISDNRLKSVLEIGCGIGNFPIDTKKLFNNKDYTGIDISRPAIDYCNRHSEFDFINADFLRYNFEKTFDLVFSMAVIDHIYSIDKFVEKSIEISDKLVLIYSYRGFTEKPEHVMKWENFNGCFYNDVSKARLRELGDCVFLTDNVVLYQ